MPTQVSVRPATTEAVTEPETPMFSLQQRRGELLKKLYLDLQLPRWDNPEVFVRYRPVESGEMAEKVSKRENEKSKNKDWAVLANADILIACCEGLYACLGEDHESKFSLRVADPTGPWTKFDGDLAVALGLPENANATHIVRAVYLTDGDLLDAANTLIEWSGQSNKKVSQDF